MRWVLISAWLIAGCEYYDKPNRPVPASFRAVTLGGKVFDRAELRGRAWAINLWVPG